MSVATDYPARFDPGTGLTWYRPADMESTRQWGWTFDPAQADSSYFPPGYEMHAALEQFEIAPGLRSEVAGSQRPATAPTPPPLSHPATPRPAIVHRALWPGETTERIVHHDHHRA
jgi:hypothetical protein